jgi:hypothetical protein
MAEQGMPRKMKYGLILAGIIVGVIILSVVVWKIKTRFRAWKSAQENKAEQQALQAQGIELSYNPNEYVGFANKLYNAMDGWGTDEDAILEVYEKLRNDLDFLELEAAFGSKDGYTLQEWLRGDLSDYYFDKINGMLQSQGVTKRI